MFDRIVSFLRDLPGSDDHRRVPPEDDPRIAAAALLFHVMDADGVREEHEKEQLKKALSAAYGVSGRELDALMRAGEEAESEAVDLYAFTSVLKRHLGPEARGEFIRLMWEMVFADGELHELEDNLVWRVAELIGVDSRERIAMRRRVQHDTPDDAE